MAASSRTMGQMQTFDTANESVTAYLKHCQLFVNANGIKDGQLVPTLLTVVGSAHLYSPLRARHPEDAERFDVRPAERDADKTSRHRAETHR